MNDVSLVTGLLVDLHPDTSGGEQAIPMFSFNRPSRAFYQGVVEALEDQGLTEKQIIAVLQSKYIRWVLDDREEELQELGRRMVHSGMVDWGKQQ